MKKSVNGPTAMALLFCAVSAGTAWAFVIAARHMRNHDLEQVAAWLLGVWIISGIVAIAMRGLKYIGVIVIAQLMATGLCLYTSNLRDPDWDILVGIGCAGMLAGMVAGIGYVAICRIPSAKPPTATLDRPSESN